MKNNIFIKAISFYQRYISPGLSPRCRYYPTCSQYTIDAIHTHGSIKGILMGTFRILRCNPLAKGGVDYVPAKFSLKKNSDCHDNHSHYRIKEKKRNR